MSSQNKTSLKSISLLIFMVLCLAAIFAPHSTGASVEGAKVPHTQNATDTFGRLPLSFELNQGQADSRVRFLARGQGYDIFLTDDGAAFSLGGSTLHLRLQDAATALLRRIPRPLRPMKSGAQRKEQVRGKNKSGRGACPRRYLDPTSGGKPLFLTCSFL